MKLNKFILKIVYYQVRFNNPNLDQNRACNNVNFLSFLPPRSAFHRAVRLLIAAFSIWLSWLIASHVIELKAQQRSTTTLNMQQHVWEQQFPFAPSISVLSGRACEYFSITPASCLQLLNRKIESHDEERSLFSSFLQQDNSLSS